MKQFSIQSFKMIPNKRKRGTRINKRALNLKTYVKKKIGKIMKELENPDLRKIPVHLLTESNEKKKWLEMICLMVPQNTDLLTDIEEMMSPHTGHLTDLGEMSRYTDHPIDMQEMPSPHTDHVIVLAKMTYLKLGLHTGDQGHITKMTYNKSNPTGIKELILDLKMSPPADHLKEAEEMIPPTGHQNNLEERIKGMKIFGSIIPYRK